MDIILSYPKWFPGLEDYYTDELMEPAKSFFEKQFPGNSFFTIPLGKDQIEAQVKIDGNRQILMYPKDTEEIIVKITNLKDKFSDI